MNMVTVGSAAVLEFLLAVLVGIYAAVVAGSRADDEWLGDRQYDEDPPTGI